jgi:hypothetical protein
LAGHAVVITEMRNLYKILIGNTEGKRPLNILEKQGEDGVWIHLTLNVVIKLRVP